MPIILKIDGKEILKKPCQNCGTLFAPIDPREVYCGPRCQEIHEGNIRKYREHSKKFAQEEEAWIEEQSDGVNPLFLE